MSTSVESELAWAGKIIGSLSGAYVCTYNDPDADCQRTDTFDPADSDNFAGMTEGRRTTFTATLMLAVADDPDDGYLVSPEDRELFASWFLTDDELATVGRLQHRTIAERTFDEQAAAWAEEDEREIWQPLEADSAREEKRAAMLQLRRLQKYTPTLMRAGCWQLAARVNELLAHCSGDVTKWEIETSDIDGTTDAVRGVLIALGYRIQDEQVTL